HNVHTVTLGFGHRTVVGRVTVALGRYVVFVGSAAVDEIRRLPRVVLLGDGGVPGRLRRRWHDTLLVGDVLGERPQRGRGVCGTTDNHDGSDRGTRPSDHGEGRDKPGHSHSSQLHA